MPDERIQKFVLMLSSSEVGIGSLLHAFHIPLAGHVLSLNQSLILTLNTSSETDRRSAFQSCAKISTLSALLKILSPAGKVLTPMIAILIQGILFSGGILVFGKNLIGVIVGSLLLALWGFLQGLLLPYVLFGWPLFQTLLDLWKRLSDLLTLPYESLYWIIGIGILFKLLAALTLAIYTWLRGKNFEEEYSRKVEYLKKSLVPPKKRRWGQKIHPWFLISLGITTFSIWINQNTSRGDLFLAIARPLVLGMVLLYLSQFIRETLARNTAFLRLK